MSKVALNSIQSWRNNPYERSHVCLLRFCGWEPFGTRSFKVISLYLILISRKIVMKSLTWSHSAMIRNRRWAGWAEWLFSATAGEGRLWAARDVLEVCGNCGFDAVEKSNNYLVFATKIAWTFFPLQSDWYVSVNRRSMWYINSCCKEKGESAWYVNTMIKWMTEKALFTINC